MTMIFDTPDDIAFFRAAARSSALKTQVESGLKVYKGRSMWNVCKEVYGLGGSMKNVSEDMEEFIEAWLRVRALPKDVYEKVVEYSNDLVNVLEHNDELSQVNFEYQIARGEENGAITHDFRQAMSDLFYVSILRQNAGNR